MQKDYICGEMAKAEKKFFSLYGNLASEMSTSDVPAAVGVDVEALKKGDSDPLEVVMEIPASESTRGWYYSSDSLRDIVNHVNSQTLNGFLGHQKPEDVSNQFLPPVTHWIGAKMEGESAFFRGIVDSAATDLKRWIRSKRIDQVSIFGMPKLSKTRGKTTVVGYKPMSIDWVPKGRAGMQTRIVAMSGEMWDLEGEGPTGEVDNNKGGAGMKPEELLAELKKMMNNKQITVPMIAGEMDWKAEQVATDIDKEWAAGVTESVTKLQEVEKALGVSGEMDVIQVAKDAAVAIKAQETAGFEKMVGEMMEEKVKSEVVRKELNDPKTTIGKMWGYHSIGLNPEQTKEELAGEMDKFLADEVVKGLISNQHTDKPAGTGGGNGNTNAPKYKTKRVSL